LADTEAEDEGDGTGDFEFEAVLDLALEVRGCHLDAVVTGNEGEGLEVAGVVGCNFAHDAGAGVGYSDTGAGDGGV
jgi:hypothetical protein